MKSPRLLLRAGRLVTCDPERASPGNGLGAIEYAAMVVENGRIADLGSEREIYDRYGDIADQIDIPGVLSPGLVDAHTHAPWVGSRDEEYAMRMAGADYEAIAAKGGGIASSCRMLRAAGLEDIAQTLKNRLSRMLSLGVTTVEAKSGYGLDEENERKQLEAISMVMQAPGMPRVVPTYLALHALPPEARGDRPLYAKTVAEQWLPRLAKLEIARFVDAYIDRSAFSVEQARPVLLKAKALGLGVRVHIGQFADVGGAELAAEMQAYSADHLENIGERGIFAMANAGVSAVLLPVASFTLRQDPPPIDAFRKAGISMVVASDANPGTAPTESLPLAMAFALRNYGLTAEESLLGATRNAAKCLGLENEIGMLKKGLAADIVAWDLPHENAILQPWACSKTLWVMREGVLVFDARRGASISGN